MSPHNKIGLNHDLTKISHIEFCRGWPYREAEFLIVFEEASYTILSLVVSADSLRTGTCGTGALFLPLLPLVYKLYLPSLQCPP